MKRVRSACLSEAGIFAAMLAEVIVFVERESEDIKRGDCLSHDEAG